ncbi:hypothetical protein ADUPG1_009786, partial [Aduncisulcus paluster]
PLSSPNPPFLPSSLPMSSLRVLLLHRNKIGSIREVEKLSSLTKLSCLSLSSNPLSRSHLHSTKKPMPNLSSLSKQQHISISRPLPVLAYRRAVLLLLPHLQCLDKHVVSMLERPGMLNSWEPAGSFPNSLDSALRLDWIDWNLERDAHRRRKELHERASEEKKVSYEQKDSEYGQDIEQTSSSLGSLSLPFQTAYLRVIEYLRKISSIFSKSSPLTLFERCVIGWKERNRVLQWKTSKKEWEDQQKREKRRKEKEEEDRIRILQRLRKKRQSQPLKRSDIEISPKSISPALSPVKSDEPLSTSPELKAKSSALLEKPQLELPGPYPPDFPEIVTTVMTEQAAGTLTLPPRPTKLPKRYGRQQYSCTSFAVSPSSLLHFRNLLNSAGSQAVLLGNLTQKEAANWIDKVKNVGQLPLLLLEWGRDEVSEPLYSSNGEPIFKNCIIRKTKARQATRNHRRRMSSSITNPSSSKTSGGIWNNALKGGVRLNLALLFWLRPLMLGNGTLLRAAGEEAHKMVMSKSIGSKSTQPKSSSFSSPLLVEMTVPDTLVGALITIIHQQMPAGILPLAYAERVAAAVCIQSVWRGKRASKLMGGIVSALTGSEFSDVFTSSSLCGDIPISSKNAYLLLPSLSDLPRLPPPCFLPTISTFSASPSESLLRVVAISRIQTFLRVRLARKTLLLRAIIAQLIEELHDQHGFYVFAKDIELVRQREKQERKRIASIKSALDQWRESRHVKMSKKKNFRKNAEEKERNVIRAVLQRDRDCSIQESEISTKSNQFPSSNPMFPLPGFCVERRIGYGIKATVSSSNSSILSVYPKATDKTSSSNISGIHALRSKDKSQLTSSASLSKKFSENSCPIRTIAASLNPSSLSIFFTSPVPPHLLSPTIEPDTARVLIEPALICRDRHFPHWDGRNVREDMIMSHVEEEDIVTGSGIDVSSTSVELLDENGLTHPELFSVVRPSVDKLLAPPKSTPFFSFSPIPVKLSSLFRHYTHIPSIFSLFPSSLFFSPSPMKSPLFLLDVGVRKRKVPAHEVTEALALGQKFSEKRRFIGGFPPL